MVEHDRVVEDISRVLEKLDAKECSREDAVLKLPAALYLSEEYWKREVDELFHKRPILLGLSCELPQPNSYSTIEGVKGFRILLTRDSEGKAHAFFNACSHRGAPVASGRGKGSRFTCPYHAWTYSTDGSLLALSRERLFGSCDKSELGLAEIRVEERYGLIFGVLDRDAPFDLDEWLGDFGPELEALDLGNTSLLWTETFEGPNWKFCRDGYIESYHFSSVHSESLPGLIGDVSVIDHFDQHSLMLLPNQPIKEYPSRPKADWNGPEALSDVYVMFPNVQFSTARGDYPLVVKIFPGDRPDRSTAVQMLLTRKPVTDEVLAEADQQLELYRQVTQKEDYVLDYAIQHAAENNQGRSFLLGRNEAAVQHFHKSIAQYVEPPVGTNGIAEI